MGNLVPCHVLREEGVRMKRSIWKHLLDSKGGCMSWVLVAQVCNPSYSGGRDQEDHGLKLVQANSL
jgi:hypothetical protein